MKLLELLRSREMELSTYPIAKGEEEYRVKREILSSIKNRSRWAALEMLHERGPLPKMENSNPKKNKENNQIETAK